MYKLLSSIWQDTIFSFQIERPSFLLIFMSEALTRSSCHYDCDQPGYLPFMYKLLFKYTVTLTTFSHALTHTLSGTMHFSGVSDGQRLQSTYKKFYPQEEKNKKKYFQKTVHIGRGGLIYRISAQG